jgi:WS/DGAT/MGAT family acyltransferase
MVDLDEVREIRKAFGTTVNDVVLAAVATSLREYLLDRGGLPAAPLVVSVPVDVRSEGGTGANQVSNMMVQLPLEPGEPLARLEAVHRNATAAKALHSAFGGSSLQDMTGLVAPTVMAGMARLYSGLRLARFHRPVMNLIISNVPGPPIDLYLAGARVAGIFPMGPVMEGSGLNVTVLSEAHHLDVGVMACAELVDDVGAVGRGIVEAVAELLALARDHPVG